MLSAAVVLMYQDYAYANVLAKHEAVVSVNKDLAYRSWVASHGGVYVPITDKTLPNTYLSHIKNRDVNTSASQQLTLMNPAYTLSQMMKDYSELYGTKGHITSRILMNPKNKPDSWEEKALEDVEITREAVYEKAIIDSEEYFRYLSPLVTEKSCLKCHAFQGYKIGDIRGGVSVSIPMKKFYEEAFSHSVVNASVIIIIYLLGLGVIFYGRRKTREILEDKIKDYEQHIFSLVNIIETRDSYTAGHTQRVAKYSVLIAKEMGFNEEKVDDMYRACMLHDIGKISTPDSILLKPGKLNALEYEIIKEHVVVSYELLSNVDIYKEIAEIVRHHHEHYDGSGYPQGLKGDEIPILSQIMTVADAFDAMTTNRIYKPRKSVKEAIKELNALSSKQFSTQIVNAATIALEDIEIEMSITQRPKSKIERERFAYFYKDQVTGIYNKEYLEFVLAYNHSDEFDMKYASGVYLHSFNQYNKKYGWAEGDKLLKKFAKILDGSGRNDLVFRIYGDDFVILNKQQIEIESYISNLEEVLIDTGITITYRHFDMREKDIKNIHDLEELL
ncbi:metal dependent phosphohydrolases (HDIG & GGDEF domains) [Sulfurimonas gotlandica GD1]|uniref:Metal dependent phosphohydrolases (HDIG & GGDEF domains) n=2 Tax=Sulfurimonas TaxID=202746 RepID=H1FVZ7_SULGG|nr:metal dependent phosphohydrolases (HDIG & GGDEF domains) [Sulfurimonas gotlandica GD1]